MLIDWIAVTLQGDSQQALGLVRSWSGGFEDLPGGGNGYDRSAKIWETGRVFWSSVRPDMGVHVRLPSSALHASKRDAFDVLGWLLKHNGNATRLDVACDDFDYHLLDLAEISRKAQENEVCTHAHQINEWHALRGVGHTIYFGARSSDRLLRIYDKAAEQVANLGGNVEMPDEYWVRVELELKGDRAKVAAQMIIDHPEKWQVLAAGWMRDFVDFKVPDFEDENKARWETCEWWLDFLDNAAKCKIPVKREEQTIERIQAWVEKQVTPTLFVLTATVGHDKLFADVGEASSRLSPRQVQLINEWNAENGKPDTQ
ncbi:MAG: replication initiation factor domain-containing protein [Anaerolineales bacterium]|nr:replication initiation factor domain-containing protein [Anaerolineales bacterium]